MRALWCLRDLRILNVACDGRRRTAKLLRVLGGLDTADAVTRTSVQYLLVLGHTLFMTFKLELLSSSNPEVINYTRRSKLQGMSNNNASSCNTGHQRAPKTKTWCTLRLPSIPAQLKSLRLGERLALLAVALLPPFCSRFDLGRPLANPSFDFTVAPLSPHSAHPLLAN